MAPEYPYPAPTNDCYSVTKYVLESGDEFGDTDRVILAGDSAGGNIVAVMTQKLLAEHVKMPKIQVLVYPWLQMFNNRMPSVVRYETAIPLDVSLGKLISWYLGVENLTSEIENIIVYNNHTLLISDVELKNKLMEYTNPELISSDFRQSRDYYHSYEHIKQNIFPETIHDSSILKRDSQLAYLLKKMFTIDLSPGLADLEILKGLPKAFFILCEMDPVKDDGLVYSERLKSAGVSVDVKIYDGYHGILTQIDQVNGYQVSRDMFEDLVKYIHLNL